MKTENIEESVDTNEGGIRMKKVKVTRGQAEAIEEFQKTVHELGISLDELKVIFESGYEVKPEFKVGDWVYDMQCNKVACVDRRGVDDIRVWVDDEDFNFFAIVNIRHATPEEIQQEKERRFWKKHGRDVWELKRGDIVRLSNGWIIEIDSIDLSQDFAVRFINQSYVEDGALLKNVQKLIIPVENRLDVKTND